MGFYLSRGHGVDRRYGLGQWPAMLKLARAFGWKAAGTMGEAAPGYKWSGRYDIMDDAHVAAEDANNLADAIERALIFFPRDDAERTLAYQVKYELWSPPNEYQQEALQWFLRDDRARSEEMSLSDFVEYCRQGAFVIS